MDWKTYWNESAFVKDVDPCRQVGRTFHQKSYSPAEIAIIVDRILAFLQADPEKHLLDLACGNGMLTSRIAAHFKSVTAVDFSVPLIESARRHFPRENVEYVVGNALDLEGIGRQYDCILIYFAFQYFSPRQADSLFGSFDRILKTPGLVLLGDVADGDRVWSFYRALPGRSRFYVDLIRNKPIIGLWWRPSDLHMLANRHSLSLSVNYQDCDSPNHYFRYDALLQRKDYSWTAAR